MGKNKSCSVAKTAQIQLLKTTEVVQLLREQDKSMKKYRLEKENTWL